MVNTRNLDNIQFTPIIRSYTRCLSVQFRSSVFFVRNRLVFHKNQRNSSQRRHSISDNVLANISTDSSLYSPESREFRQYLVHHCDLDNRIRSVQTFNEHSIKRSVYQSSFMDQRKPSASPSLCLAISWIYPTSSFLANISIDPSRTLARYQESWQYSVYPYHFNIVFEMSEHSMNI